MNIEKFIAEVLNSSKGVRPKLRELVPLIDRIESADQLRDLAITSLKLRPYNIIELAYEATATPEIYPHPRVRLIQARVLKPHEVKSNSLHCPESSNKNNLLILANYGHQLRIELRIFNPDYQPQ
jgi:hypothetical protein